MLPNNKDNYMKRCFCKNYAVHRKYIYFQLEPVLDVQLSELAFHTHVECEYRMLIGRHSYIKSCKFYHLKDCFKFSRKIKSSTCTAGNVINT